MTRGEALKDFFRKTILPVAAAALLYCIFRSACVKNGELDYLWLWIQWVHLRKSNTEPIIRVYSEAATMEAADEIGQKIMDVVYSLAK